MEKFGYEDNGGRTGYFILDPLSFPIERRLVMKRFMLSLVAGLTCLLAFTHHQVTAAEKYTKYETAGMSFEYPSDWKSFPRDFVAGMKSSMASELRKYNRTLKVLEMYISPNEEVAFFFSLVDPEPSITVQSIVEERKKVYEDATKAGDVTKVNALSEIKVNKWSAVREDVDRSNGGRGCTVKVLVQGNLLEFSLIVNNKANFDKYQGELDHILFSLSVGGSRTVGTFRFTVPVDWTPLSAADLRDARREIEGLIKPSYAGPATLESFEYFLLPDNSGMFLAWTIRIPEQKDFLTKIQKEEAAHVETYRRQGQIRGGTCEVVKISGTEVVRVEVDRVNGAKAINFHHWSSEAPGVISLLQLGLRPTRSAKSESDAKAMFDSLTVKAETSIGTNVVNKKVGIAFYVPKGIEIYSEDNPGPLRSRISAETSYFLVNPDFRDENVNIKIADGVTGSDLNGLKQLLDSNPNTPLPEYKRIAVKFINIGKDGKLKAVEHQYQMKGNVLGTMRNITFVIGNRGFIITCGTAVERFEKANKEFFEPFLKSIEPVK